MEETHFIKCNREWPSETEESPNVEPEAMLCIKVDPCRTSDEDVSMSTTEDIKQELEDDFDSGTLPYIVCVQTMYYIDNILISSQDIKQELEDDFDSATLPNEVQCVLHPDGYEASSCNSTRERAAQSNGNLECKRRKPYACKECGIRFRVQSELTQHLLIHTGGKPLVCNICCKTFRWKRTLRDHIMRHMGQKSYVCPVCSRTFVANGDLKSHMVMHSTERRYKCDKCGKAFTHRSSLKTHIMRHDNQKNYRCRICGKAFVVVMNLKAHMVAVHTAEKKYKCDQPTCSKSFAQPGALREHMLQHLGRRFICHYCPKKFKSRFGLTTHLDRHAGIMPRKNHSCALCSKSYVTTTGLKHHMLSHSGERPFVCNSCGKAYPHKTTLKEHLLTHGH